MDTENVIEPPVMDVDRNFNTEPNNPAATEHIQRRSGSPATPVPASEAPIANPKPTEEDDKATLDSASDRLLDPPEDVLMDITENDELKEERLPPTAAPSDLPGKLPSRSERSPNPELSMLATQLPTDSLSNTPSTPLDTEQSLRPSASDLHLPPVSYIEGQGIDRPLNVTDALSYLDAVKVQFHDQPEVYNHFLDIMKDFKSQLIDTPGVIRRVSQLFNGHPALIQGFNTFLPVGYRIECSSDPQQSAFITVTTPSGTVVQSTHEDMPGPSGSTQWSSFTHLNGPGGSSTIGAGQTDILPSDPITHGMDSVSIEPAVQYIQKIKQRCDEGTYRRFLEILKRYHSSTGDGVDEVSVPRSYRTLFKLTFSNRPRERSQAKLPGFSRMTQTCALISAYSCQTRAKLLFDDAEENFLAVAVSERRTRSSTPLDGRSMRRKSDISLTAIAEAATIPQKRKRRANEREREKDTVSKTSLPRPKQANGDSYEPIGSPTYTMFNPPPGIGLDETHFFDRVKRAINNREAFNEFLKLVNLFTQELIDTARLVREARNFLGDGDLMQQFREILCWDDRRERERWILEEQQQQQAWARAQGQSIPIMPLRPGRINTGLQQGSYRRIPASEAHMACSGRDDMCRSVLNDEWVSHPTWSSEDSGFVAHKKNVYEEALHRSEEERHEYDFYIEAIVRTIAMLEPINNKIAQLSVEERAGFKLKPNLGGSGKSIHQRIIKKIYGREVGQEVLQAMQETPALAIPVVLMRLKAKEEMWKRAQREWNKVWRAVDAQNYLKSLDHQAIHFKMADKKAITAKAFIGQIEAARDEQMDKRSSYIDPLFARTHPKHQLAFEVGDMAVLQDGVKITLSLLDRMQSQVNVADRKKIEGFLRSFVPLFFAIDPDAFNHTLLVTQDAGDNETGDEMSSVADDADTASAASTSSRAGSRSRKVGGTSSGDLRKKLLKSEQAKSSNRKSRGQDGTSPVASRPVSPSVPDKIPGDEGVTDAEPSSQMRPALRRHVFFSNNVCYVFLRLLEVVYARLSYFKNLAASMANEPLRAGEAPAAKLASVAEIAQLDERAAHTEHFYDLMLESCERLFDNEVEQHIFEEQMRYMFGVKHAYRIFTIDKVVGALIKQVQLALADPRSQELLELLKRDRALSSPTNQDQLNSRRLAENIIGPDENVYRVDWNHSTKTMTVQLLGKDDSTAYDAEILAERWQAYIDTYVSENATRGFPSARLKGPFLQKNLPLDTEIALPDLTAQGRLEIRVCIRTYRLFYVPGTEDYLHRRYQDMEKDGLERRIGKAKQRQKLWLDKVKAGKDWSPTLARTQTSISDQPQA
ncbi:hypothetical protein EDC04DRAFT_2897379 [Pisolithus marmoratus]|nr:hypothetical protein EDC04DRAFT_2897379 [Pisolithus marmoratus]